MSVLTISAHDFARLLDTLSKPIDRKIGVAVSGGPDSMALTFLLHQWAKKNKVDLYGFHVDHQLRDTSHMEARQVEGWLRDMGIPCEILVWEHEEIQRKVQEKARQARYSLIADAAKEKDIKQLFLGHHLDDQIETFLLRLECGSGVGGLSGMQRVTEIYGLTLMRPFLSLPQIKLQDVVAHARIPFIEDPSNYNEEFARVRMRKLSKIMLDYGFNSDRLGRTITKIAETHDAMTSMARDIIKRHSVCHNAGYISIAAEPLQAMPKALILCVLDWLIRGLSGQSYPLRYKRLEHCYNTFIQNNELGACTLGRCYIKRRRETFLFCREEGHLEAPMVLKKSGKYHWDDRFLVDLSTNNTLPSEFTLGALGQKGWQQISPYCKSDLPSYILYVLPAIWLHDRVIAQPHLDFGCVEWLNISFAPYIL